MVACPNCHRRVGLLAMLLVVVKLGCWRRFTVCAGARHPRIDVIVDTFATFFVLVVLYLCAAIRAQTAQTQFGGLSLSRESPPALPLLRNTHRRRRRLAVIVTLFLLPVHLAAPSSDSFSQPPEVLSLGS